MNFQEIIKDEILSRESGSGEATIDFRGGQITCKYIVQHEVLNECPETHDTPYTSDIESSGSVSNIAISYDDESEETREDFEF